MAKARKSKTTNKGGRPVKRGNPQTVPVPKAPLSLPPAEPEQATTSPTLQEPDQSPDAVKFGLMVDKPKPFPMYAEDGKVRLTALKIVAMRQAGMGEDEIAKALGLSRSTLAGYVYKAGRNGWLDLEDPKDRLEYQVMHKVVRNLDEALDSEHILQTGMPVRSAVALKIGEGTLFKKFAEQAPVNQQTIVAIKIEMPTGGESAQIREGTTGGAPAFLDGEKVHES